MIRKTFLVCAVALMILPNCSYDLCDEFFNGTCPAVTGGSGGTGAGGTGATGAQGGDGGTGGNTGGDGGTGGGPPPGCTPTEGEAIGSMCGVFVDASSVGGDGSLSSPYDTLTAAVQNLNSAEHIYVCGSDVFSGSITLPSGVSLTGGLTCGTWVYASSNARPTVEGTQDIPALTLSGAGDRTVESFTVQSPSAVALGASSIGVLADGATATLRNVDIIAGNGAPGAAGMPQNKDVTPVMANGGNGLNGCINGMGVIGGGGGQQTCQGNNVGGGIGGSGTNGATGGSGSDGQPAGLLGQGGLEDPLNAGSCQQGQGGVSGTAGTPGTGALSTEEGLLSTTGYTGAAGGNGQTAGSAGQGGGGGGGGNVCTGNGPSGGGGGAGGCGGSVGAAGLGGGGSFGIISINAPLELENVTIGLGNGGQGGSGDAGQPGMDGGIEGNQGTGGGACPGGPGGAGGRGGAGGGGRGGPSVGIATVGTAPAEMTVEITTGSPGAAGPGGDGGPGNMATAGAAGVAEARRTWP